MITQAWRRCPGGFILLVLFRNALSSSAQLLLLIMRIVSPTYTAKMERREGWKLGLIVPWWVSGSCWNLWRCSCRQSMQATSLRQRIKSVCVKDERVLSRTRNAWTVCRINQASSCDHTSGGIIFVIRLSVHWAFTQDGSWHEPEEAQLGVLRFAGDNHDTLEMS